MADPDPHLLRLTELGLSRYEAKAYLTLIQRESYIASELAIEAGIPRQRIYDVLNRLVARGLAQDWPSAITRYAATDPQTAVQRLLDIQRHSLTGLERASTDLATDLHVTWESGRTETTPLDYIEVLRDPCLLADRFLDLQREAQFQLLLFAKQPYALPANPIGLEATRRIARAGGDIRCIYEADLFSQPAALAETVQFIQAGERARVVEQLPMKLCLADGHRALFSLTDPIAGGLTSTNILIDHPALADTLRTSFEAAWLQAEPIDHLLNPTADSKSA